MSGERIKLIFQDVPDLEVTGVPADSQDPDAMFFSRTLDRENIDDSVATVLTYLSASGLLGKELAFTKNSQSPAVDKITSSLRNKLGLEEDQDSVLLTPELQEKISPEAS